MPDKIDHLIRTWCNVEFEVSPDRHQVQRLREFLQLDYMLDTLMHDSWRCKYYQKCHCGLDDVTDNLGMERISTEYCAG